MLVKVIESREGVAIDNGGGGSETDDDAMVIGLKRLLFKCYPINATFLSGKERTIFEYFAILFREIHIIDKNFHTLIFFDNVYQDVPYEIF